MTTPEKLSMLTQNIVDQNVEKIAGLFPNCITQIVDNGESKKVVDFDKLRQELSDFIVDGSTERYSFNWPEKKKATLLANAPCNKTLRPVRKMSVNFDTTKNIYIEGDNLEVLKCLREAYLGKVKMIYIDPPYNTGNDFVYKDDFKESVTAYLQQSEQVDREGNRLVANTESNGRFHTDWLNMMYPRLKVARDLLSPDGVIFISIDDHEVCNLRKICDEVFGEENLVSQIPWQSRASIQNDTDISVNHEYICVYAKTRRLENRRLKESNKHLWYQKDSFVCKPLPLEKDNFDNPDGDPRGPWKADPFDAPNIRPNLTYPITNPNTGVEYYPPEDRHWRCDKETYERLYADNRIIFGTTGESKPQLKVFYQEKKEFGSIDNTWFSADRMGTTTEATKALKKLFGNKKYFDTPKPVSLLKHLIYLANVSDNDIVLDFFAGSGSTAQAVMEFNAEYKTNLKFIICQVDEPLEEKSKAFKDGLKTISDVCRKRIELADSKINKGLDCKGFRFFRLDESNMNPVSYPPQNVQQQEIFSLIDNLKPDRTAEDLLVQVIMSLGVTLDCSIEQKTIAGKNVFNVSNGYLVACFDKDVTDEVVTAIAKEQPVYVVLRDACFSSDSVADNFEQIFKTYAPETICKVI